MIVDIVFNDDVDADHVVCHTDCCFECLDRKMMLGEVEEFKIVSKDSDCNWVEENLARLLYIDLNSVKEILIVNKNL